MEDERFEPVPFQPVSEPERLKAFGDATRVRILHILADREATNQQLSVMLDQPQARVLHHVRALLDAGLIVLVDERIKGGNVEKYYRSVARIFGIRLYESGAEELGGTLTGAVFESITQEVVASLNHWPKQPLYWETRRANLTPERVAEFDHRLNQLLAEFWGELDAAPGDDQTGDYMATATVIYRFPGEPDE